MLTAFPAERWLLIEDNLGAHISHETQLALLAWPEIHVPFLPKYACWLNLIEPWWKQLRALALNGRRFDTVDALIGALDAAVAYWNAHKHP